MVSNILIAIACLLTLLSVLIVLQRAGYVPEIIPFLNVQEPPVIGDAPALVYDPLERPVDIHNSDERDIIISG